LLAYSDPCPPPGKTDYWLQLVGQDGGAEEAWFGPVRLSAAQPPRATVLQNVYPNPFNPQTTVAFSVSRAQRVRVSVFDLTGREVAVLADHLYRPGTYTVDWDGRDTSDRAVASGSYLVRLNATEREESRKITLVR
jgi:hypothetical protein